MASIATFSGLASGIQWRDMIDQIMKLESSRRISPVTGQIKLQEQRKSAWGEYNNLVTKLRDASKSFSDGSAFGVFKTSVGNSPASGRALVSATASDQAAAGSYSVEVLQLAQAEKVGSAAVASATTDLGMAGTFHVNGRAVTLDAGDTLSALRDKINAANTGSNASGVTATILSTSSTSHRLILTADATGSRGIELIDSTSGVLKDSRLGILSGSQTSNASPAESGWTDSLRFSSRTEVLKDVLGVSPPPAVSNILVGGVPVEVDFNTDTLNDVLSKLQAVDPLAKLREEVVNGKKMHRLSTSMSVAADPGSPDSLRNLELLGFVKDSSASPINAGRDATFQVDGFNLTRRGNTVTDAIQGVTLELIASDTSARTSTVSSTDLTISKDPKSLDAGTYEIQLQDNGAGTITGATLGGEAASWDAGTRTIRGAAGSRFEGMEITYAGTATSGRLGDLTVQGDIAVDVRIERDADATTKKVEEFADLYNKMAEFAKRQRDAKGPLGSDGSLRTMVASLRDVLFSEVSGLSASNPYSRLTLVGVEFTRTGTLKVDSTAFRKAVAAGAADVKELFAGVGSMMKTAADALADSAEGRIKLHQENLTSSISSLGLREINVQAQLDRRRTDLVKQFTKMEEAMSRIQSQSNSLASQIMSLAPR